MSGIPLISGSVELGNVDIPASGQIVLSLPVPVVTRLEDGWASLRPIFTPCSPHDSQCGGTRTRIDHLRLIA